MANVTITLPSSFSIVSRKVGIDADVAALPVNIIEALVLHGLTQKVADSAAGAMKACGFDGRKFDELEEHEQAKVQDWGKEAMGSVLSGLQSGQWATRAASGVAVSPLVKRMRVLFGAFLRTNEKAVWASIKDADDKDELIDAMIGDLDDAAHLYFENAAKKELEQEAATKAGIGALKIKIALPSKK